MENSSNRTRLRTLWADDSGSTAIEYALIGSLVSITIIAGSSGIRDQLNLIFANVAAQLAAAAAAN